MIRSFLTKIIAMIKDPSRSFRERIFILLTLVTSLVATLALLGDIAYGENIVEIITLIITISVVPFITFISIKKNIVNLVSKIVVLGVVFVLLPILFFFGGGMDGGGIIWIIFAFLYTGLVLSGKWKPAILVVLTLETIIFYALDYFFPKLVIHHSRESFDFDSLISIIMVGLISCLVVWFEEWLYQEENKRAREETRKIEELISNQNSFFSSMSHEIRTPINSILGLNEIILRQEDASDEIIKDARNIQGSGRMLLSLVNDILDVSKMEAGEMDIVPVNYNLGTLVLDIVNIMWFRAQEKGLELNIEIDPTIPAELFGDEMRIKQILINLLNNAVKYTNEGSVTLHVEKGELSAGYVLLLFSVIDTGIGIKQDAIPYLFDAFRRVDEEKNAGIEGTGLGLAIVKRLVELMNGRITVSSVYTEGSTFIVSLRQKVTRQESIGEIDIKNLGFRRQSSKYVPKFIAPDARILIVDDNEMNLNVETKLICDTLMKIDTASSGDEALSMTLSEKYDLIFMDHLMPEMDGIECLQYIRKQSGGLNTQVPVIALTANAGSAMRELYTKSGFDGYLLKPISGDEFEEILLEHLPEIKVKRTKTDDSSDVRTGLQRGYSKKLSVIVATSSMCDLPQHTLEDSQIDIIPFSIISDGKTYFDRIEAGTDEVINYIRHGAGFESIPPSVKDFERFFGKEIKKAHEVIYIALSPGISKEYDNALEAAREYGNVRIFDSSLNSGAMGFLVLIAYRMSMQGISTDRIIEELEAAKKRIRCSFITGDAELMMRRGTIGKWIYGFIRTFGFKPGIVMKNGALSINKLFVGEFEKCYDEYIEYMLPKRIKPDLDVIIVEYVELSESGRKRVEETIRRRFSFEHIVFQKASAVMSINCGMGALGVFYMLKGNTSYELSKHLVLQDKPWEYENWPEEDMGFSPDAAKIYETENVNPMTDAFAYDDSKEEEIENQSECAKEKWHKKLPEIDYETALEYSGSDDALLSVIKIFYESIDKKADEIEGYFDNEDYKNYTIKVHALKSSSRLVGATELGDHAEALENAGKNEEYDYIKKNTKELLSEFRSYKDVFGRIFDSDKADDIEENKTIDVNEQFDKDLLESIYDGISEGAENADTTMIEEILDEISDYELPKKDTDKLTMIKECLKTKDFEEIKNLINGNS